MQKQNPVIKNYILSSEVIIMEEDKESVCKEKSDKKLYTSAILFPAEIAGG